MEMFGRFCTAWERQTGSRPGREWLAGWQYVEITNAAEYFYEHEREHWDIKDAFPISVPPWKSAWMEFKYPRISRDDDGKTLPWPSDMYGGAFIDCEEIPWGLRQKAIEDDFLTRRLRDKVLKRFGLPLNDASSQETRIASALELKREARWMATFEIWIAFGQKVAPYGIQGYYYDHDGRAITELIHIIPIQPGSGVVGGGSVVLPYFYAISLLHCRNVTLEDAEISRKVRRRWQKVDRPDVVFKQLIVHPITRIRYDQADAQSTGQRTRLHICRGHFKDYRNGSGLFGRYKGLYWWPQHLRGDAEVGRVFKDYVVESEVVDLE